MPSVFPCRPAPSAALGGPSLDVGAQARETVLEPLSRGPLRVLVGVLDLLREALQACS